LTFTPEVRDFSIKGAHSLQKELGWHVKWLVCGAVLLTALADFPTTSGQQVQAKFAAAAIVYAGDVNYPANSDAAGLVTLCVGLNASGRVQEVRTLRDIPSLTLPALLAVNDWTFAPAVLVSKPQASRISVDVLFSPPEVLLSNVPLPPVEEACPSQSKGFTPPEVVAACYGPVIMNSTTIGSTLLNVTADKAGRVEKVSPVWPGDPARAKLAIATVMKWRFKPGLLDGVPVDSQTVVVFVFRLS
jgi:hypothetical protein